MMFKIRATIVALIIFMFSCSSSIKSNDIESKLIGTWILDSTLSADRTFYKDEHTGEILIFKSDNNYSYDWSDGDVGNKVHGAYYVHQKQLRSTIAFIADLQIVNKDTVRQYLNYDIISISDTTLKVVEETKFIEKKKNPSLIYNKQYIYRRKK